MSAERLNDKDQCQTLLIYFITTTTAFVFLNHLHYCMLLITHVYIQFLKYIILLGINVGSFRLYIELSRSLS